MKQPVDWIRAAFTGAFVGGFLWSIMVKMLSVLTHGAISTRFLYTFLPSVSLCVLAIGVVLYLWAKTSLWRSTAVGIIIAPLTGWSILLFVTVTVVVPSQWTH
jgi:hypothetical protein